MPDYNKNLQDLLVKIAERKEPGLGSQITPEYVSGIEQKYNGDYNAILRKALTQEAVRLNKDTSLITDDYINSIGNKYGIFNQKEVKEIPTLTKHQLDSLEKTSTQEPVIPFQNKELSTGFSNTQIKGNTTTVDDNGRTPLTNEQIELAKKTINTQYGEINKMLDKNSFNTGNEYIDKAINKVSENIPGWLLKAAGTMYGPVTGLATQVLDKLVIPDSTKEKAASRKDLADAKSNLRIAEKTLNIDDEESLKSFGQGLTKPLFKDFISIGTTETLRSMNEAGITKKIKNGEELTPEEQKLADSYAFLSYIQQNKDLPLTAEIGNAISVMAPYMAEFAATGGTNEMVKGGVNALLKTSEKQGLKKALSQLTAYSAGAGAQAATMPISLTKNVSDRMVGDYQFNPEGKAVYIDGTSESMPEALGKGYVMQIGEVFGENAFKGLTKNGAKSIGTKLGLNPDKLDNFFKSIEVNPAIKKATGFTNILEEFGEEHVTNLIQATVDDDWKDFYSLRSQLVLAGSVLGVQGAFSAYSAGDKIHRKIGYDKAYNRAIENFNKLPEEVKNAASVYVNNDSPEETAKGLSSLYNKGVIKDEHKDTITQYLFAKYAYDSGKSFENSKQATDYIVNNISNNLETRLSPFVNQKEDKITRATLTTKEGELPVYITENVDDKTAIIVDEQGNKRMVAKSDFKVTDELKYSEFKNSQIQSALDALNYEQDLEEADNIQAEQNSKQTIGQQITINGKNYVISQTNADGAVLAEITDDGMGEVIEVPIEQLNQIGQEQIQKQEPKTFPVNVGDMQFEALQTENGFILNHETTDKKEADKIAKQLNDKFDGKYMAEVSEETIDPQNPLSDSNYTIHLRPITNEQNAQGQQTQTEPIQQKDSQGEKEIIQPEEQLGNVGGGIDGLNNNTTNRGTLEERGFNTNRMEDFHQNFYQNEEPEQMAMDIIQELGKRYDTKFPFIKNEGQLAIIQENINQHLENGMELLSDTKQAINGITQAIKDRRITPINGKPMGVNMYEEEVIINRLLNDGENTLKAVNETLGNRLLEYNGELSNFVDDLSDNELYKLYDYVNTQRKTNNRPEGSIGNVSGTVSQEVPKQGTETKDRTGETSTIKYYDGTIVSGQITKDSGSSVTINKNGINYTVPPSRILTKEQLKQLQDLNNDTESKPTGGGSNIIEIKVPPVVEQRNNPNSTEDKRSGMGNLSDGGIEQNKVNGAVSEPNGNIRNGNNGGTDTKDRAVSERPEISRNDSISKADTPEAKHNKLINLLKELNDTPKSYTNKRNNIRKQIDGLMVDLKYKYTNEPNRLWAEDNNGNPIKRKAIKPAKEEVEQHKTLSEYPQEFIDFVNLLFDNPATLLSVDLAYSNNELKPIIENIRKGKKGVGHNTVLDILENMFKNNTISIKQTNTNPRINLTLNEFIEIVNNNTKEAESTPEDVINEIITQHLSELYISEEDNNNIFNYGKETGLEEIKPDTKKEVVSATTNIEETKGKEPREIVAIKTKIANLRQELKDTIKEKNRVYANANNRNGLFGDTKSEQNSLFPETFNVNKETIDKLIKPFNDKIETLKREISNIEKTITTGEKELSGQQTIPESAQKDQKQEDYTQNGIKETQEQINARLLEERKQRILNEGTGFDKPFGLIQPKNIKTVDDLLSNINKIISTLKSNEGNKKYDIFEGFAYKNNYSKNAGEQIRQYFIALDVLPNWLRKEFSESINIKNYNELSNWASKQYDKTTQPLSEQGKADAGEIPSALTTKKEAPESINEQTQKIEDFGEKLEGARKDMVSKIEKQIKVTDEDLMEQPLSKTMPIVDYNELVNSGLATKEEAALLFYMREKIGVKPQNSWKKKRWLEGVKSYRDVLRWITNKDEFAKSNNGKSFMDLVNTKLSFRALNDVQSRIKLLVDLGFPESSQNIGYFSIKYFDGVSSYIYKNGEKSTKPVYSVVNKSNIIKDFDTYEEAIAGLKYILSTIKEKENTVKFDIWTERGNDGYIVGKKVASGKYIPLKQFNELPEARKYIKENQAELEKMLDEKKIIPSERPKTQSPRIGKKYSNQNVTPELFQQTFGFRGVQFGNYVEQDKRQKDLNDTFDALMDLAEILNIPPQAISLGGKLGIAFGARGKGGKGAASAHYEPDTVVINITKERGAGSLAHEWFHAMDNYFSRQRNTKLGYLTERPRQLLKQDGSKDESIRPEVIEAFNDLVKSIQKSGLPKRSGNLDARRSKDYWGEIVEMAARSFESYVKTKLDENGYKNDYLVSFNDLVSYIVQSGASNEDYPYPTEEESVIINKAFENLFNTIKTKQVDDSVILFRKTDPIETIQELQDNTENAIPLEIIDSPEQFPKRVKEDPNFDNNVEAVNFGGKVYVLKSKIKNRDHAIALWIHEVGIHGGLGKLMNRLGINKEDKNKFLTNVWKSANELAKTNQTIKEVVDRVKRSYGNNPVVLGEEFIAYYAEKIVKGEDLKPVERKVWKQILDGFRTLLEKVFNFDSRYLTEKEINDVVKAIIQENYVSSDFNQTNDRGIRQRKQNDVSTGERTFTGKPNPYSIFGGVLSGKQDRNGQRGIDGDSSSKFSKDEIDKAYGNTSLLQQAASNTVRDTRNRINDVFDNQRKSFKGVQKRTVLEGFEESGSTNVVGIQIGGAQDIADLWSIHRSPYIEKAHIIFLKGKTIIGTTATTLNKVDHTSFLEPQEIIDLYNKFGADGMYFLHNHPSGNHTVSIGDVNVTNNHLLIYKLSNVNLIGHIVLDHNKFSLIDLKAEPLNDNSQRYLEYYVKSKVKSFEYKNPVPKLFSDREQLPAGEEAPKRMLEIGKALLNGTGYKGAIVYLTPSLHISAYDVIPNEVNEEQVSQLTQKGHDSNLGSSSIIVHDGSFNFSNIYMPNGTIDVINTKTNDSDYFARKGRSSFNKEDIIKLWDRAIEYGNKPQIETPEFKKWFGNSKVVDENGKPLVVYHGSPDGRFLESDEAIFMTPSQKYSKSIGNDFSYKAPHFFTNDISTAKSYTDERRAFDYQNAKSKIADVYLSINNPLEINAMGKEWNKYEYEIEGEKVKGTYNITNKAIEKGFDGIIIKNVKDHYNNNLYSKSSNVYVVFSPTQIKSATGNNGQFDANNPDIRFRKSESKPFYSTVENSLNKIQVEKATPEQWKAQLEKNGAKQAELDWMGWDEFVKEQRIDGLINKTINKQAIQEWINGNKIEIQEVERNDQKDRVQVFSVKEQAEYENKGYYIETDYNDYEPRTYAVKDKANTKYSQYQTEGGEGYFELVLTMPGQIEPYKPDNKHFTEEGGGTAVAWVRAKEHKSTNGDRVLFIEEFQSKRAQDGKKKGFDSKETKVKRDKLHKEWSEVENEMIPLQRRNRAYNEGVHSAKLTNDELQRLNYLEKRDKELADENKLLGLIPVPDMPFKQTPQWVNLALRRMLKYAADNNFDRIAWTPGFVQAERYDLSKQIGLASARKDKGGKYYLILEDKAGNEIDPYSRSGKALTPSEMEDVIGKDLSKKLTEGADRNFGKPWPKNVSSNPEFFNLRGIDLKVGGEGMIAFYDKIVPTQAKKVGKPFGVYVQPTEIILKENTYEPAGNQSINMQTGEVEPGARNNGKTLKVLSLPINDKMRESMPMFRKEEVNGFDNIPDEVKSKLDKIEKDYNESEYKPSRVEYGINDKGKIFGTVDEINKHHKLISDYLVTALNGLGYNHASVSAAKSGTLYVYKYGTGSGESIRISDHLGRGGIFAPTHNISTLSEAKTIIRNTETNAIIEEKNKAERIKNQSEFDKRKSLFEELKSKGLGYKESNRTYQTADEFKSKHPNVSVIKTNNLDGKAFNHEYIAPFDEYSKTPSLIFTDWYNNSNSVKFSKSNEDSPLTQKVEKEAKEQRKLEKQAKVMTKASRARQAIFDNKLAIKRFIDKIVKEGGKLSEKTDPYVTETLSHSRVLHRQQSVFEKQYIPAVKEIARLSKKLNVKARNIYDYLIAKHSIERNENFINKELEDKRAKLESEGIDPVEITMQIEALKLDLETQYEKGTYNKAGVTKQDALEQIKWFEEKTTLSERNKLHSLVQSLSDKHLDYMLEYQTIDRETYDKIKKMYNFYVPLRGWDKTADSELIYRDASSEAFNSRMKKAEGRTSYADNPIANLMNMMDSVIIQGEKNRIKLHMKWFLQNNKEHLKNNASFRTSFKIYKNVDGVNEDIGEEYFSKSDIPTEYLEEPYKIATKIDTSTKGLKTKKQEKDHEVVLYEGGKMYILQFNDPEVAMALNNKDFNAGLESVSAFMSKNIRPVTGFISSMMTSRNPGFIVPNTLRDYMLASTVHYVKGGVKQYALFQKNMVMVQRALLVGSKEGMDDKMRDLYFKFKEFGAETGYVHLRDVSEFKKSLNRDIKRLQGEPMAITGHYAKKPFEVLHKMASWSENMTRFATFVTSVEMGKSYSQAAFDAKTVTVNFNKKGRVSGILGSIYAFFNAGLQGVNLYGRLWGINAPRMAVAHLTFMATGFLSAYLTDLFGDDDDDELFSDKISDYTKYNHFIFPTGEKDKYIKVPMAHIFRLWHGLGSMGYEVYKEMARLDVSHLSEDKKKQRLEKFIDQRLFYIIGAIPQDFLPVDVGGIVNKNGNLTAAPFTPTFAKPVQELVSNENFMSIPIYRESFWDENKANSQRYFNSINPYLKAFTDRLYVSGGGDLKTQTKYYLEGVEQKRIPRQNDINPEYIEHLLQGYFGGTGTFLKNVTQTAASIIRDEEITMDEFPVAHRFIGNARYDRTTSDFFKNRDSKNTIKDLLEGKKFDDLTPEQQDLAREVNVFDSYDKQISKMKRYLKQEGITQERKEYFENQIKLLMQEANKTME